jgi:hypothetical protein
MMDTNTGNVYGPTEYCPGSDSIVEIPEDDFDRLRKLHLKESRKLMRKLHQQEAKRRRQ